MAQEKYLGETGLRRLSELIKEDLGHKANLDGSYDSLQAGSAKQLVSPTGVYDSTPYIFRTTAGSANVSDGLAELKSIRGKTIVWNQLADIKNPFTTDLQGNAISTKLFVFNKSHVYLEVFDYEISSIVGNVYFLFGTWNEEMTKYIRTKYTPTALKGNFAKIVSKSDYYDYSNYNGDVLIGKVVFQCLGTDVSSENTVSIKNVRLHDLTTMFGAGHEPTSVQEFIRDYHKPYYPYDAGTIKNVLPEAKKSVGYNLLTTNRVKGTQSGNLPANKRTFSEGEYYVGLTANNNYFEGNVNSYSVSDNRVTCNSGGLLYGVSFPVRVIGGQTYTIEFTSSAGTSNHQAIGWYDADGNFISLNYIKGNPLTAPANAYWGNIVLGSETANTEIVFTDICFHLTHSGSRTGFEPHEEHVLHIDTAQYFPDGMNGVGTAYDELTPKRAIKRMGKVDLGTMTWGKMSNGKMYSPSIEGVIKQNTNYDGYPNLVCAKYTTDKPSTMASSSPTDKTISVGGNGVTVIVFDSDYADETAFKQAMSGVYLYYELATPEITEIPQTRDINWTYQMSDYGTEEYLVAIGHEVPVAHETFYMDNLVDKLRNLPEPSEYQEVVDKVNAPKLLSDIVDAEGHPRFLVQSLNMESAVSPYFKNFKGYLALNGNLLKISVKFTIPSGTTIPNASKSVVGEADFPYWLKEKISPLDGSAWTNANKKLANEFVPYAVKNLGDAQYSTTQVQIGGSCLLSGRLTASNFYFGIRLSGLGKDLTVDSDAVFHHEWDFVIE